MMERDGFSEAAHRYLDGDPGQAAELGLDERAAADRLASAAGAYAARLEPLAATLDQRVMSAVLAKAGGRERRSGVRWLFAPRTVRVRPVWIPALVAAAALVLWLLPRAPAVPAAPERGATVTPLAAVMPDTVYVHFELVAPQAHSVAVAGTFNGWRVGALEMTRRGDGLWSVTAPLPVGEHRYDFVVDGTHWVPDPTAHIQVEDGFGGRNSVIVVGPRGLVRS